MNFDIYLVLKELKKKRASFVSEADFQFSLAWEIQTQYPNAKIRLEYPFNFNKSTYLDILVVLNDDLYPIELKHKTKRHGAKDIGCYNFLKDITRIEKIRKECSNFKKGYCIMLTNYKSYLDSPREEVYYWDLRLTNKRKIEKNSILSFSENFALHKKFPPLKIENEYTIIWEKYSKLNKNNEQWYLLINEVL
nr:hypothetical protein [Methanobrevibacter arboriphilus]